MPSKCMQNVAWIVLFAALLIAPLTEAASAYRDGDEGKSTKTSYAGFYIAGIITLAISILMAALGIVIGGVLIYRRCQTDSDREKEQQDALIAAAAEAKKSEGGGGPKKTEKSEEPAKSEKTEKSEEPAKL